MLVDLVTNLKFLDKLTYKNKVVSVDWRSVGMLTANSKIAASAFFTKTNFLLNPFYFNSIHIMPLIIRNYWSCVFLVAHIMSLIIRKFLKPPLSGYFI